MQASTWTLRISSCFCQEFRGFCPFESLAVKDIISVILLFKENGQLLPEVFQAPNFIRLQSNILLALDNTIQTTPTPKNQEKDSRLAADWAHW